MNNLTNTITAFSLGALRACTPYEELVNIDGNIISKTELIEFWRNKHSDSDRKTEISKDKKMERQKKRGVSKSKKRSNNIEAIDKKV